ncbi:MAG: hypothetical protein KGL39_45385 [Patescibacteria group bacterium]|nr:hypothetical protein [Patescibacteria group bacterium]
MIHSTYYGVTIWRNTEPSYRLRWTAGHLAADTLAGIKQLIREQHHHSDHAK